MGAIFSRNEPPYVSRDLQRLEHGVTSLEYGLIAALTAMAIVLVLATAGDTIVAMYQWVADWVGWVVNYALGSPGEPMPGS